MAGARKTRSASKQQIDTEAEATPIEPSSPLSDIVVLSGKAIKARKAAKAANAEAVKQFKSVWAQFKARTPYVDPNYCESYASEDEHDSDDDEDGDEAECPYGLRAWNSAWNWNSKQAHLQDTYYTKKTLDLANRRGKDLIYDFLSANELRSFVRARNLEDPLPCGLTLSYHYIKVLEHANKNPPPFRFLDLAPEMRNLIYELVLVVPDECVCGTIHEDKCTPQILLSCRQVYDEAKEILYAENTVKCSFSSVMMNDFEFQENEMLHRTRRTALGGIGNLSAIQVSSLTLQSYPDFFRRIQKLDIDAHFCDCRRIAHDPDEACHFLGSSLLSLISFLMDNHRLKKLNVRISSTAEITEKQVATILYPFRRLRNVAIVTITLRIHGTEVPPQVTEDVIEAMKSITTSFNTLKWYSLLKKQSQAYTSVANVVAPDREDGLAEDGFEFVGRARHAERVLEETDKKLYDGVGNEEQEYGVMQKLAETRDILSEMDQSKLERRVRKLRNAGKELRKYSLQGDHSEIPATYEKSKCTTHRGMNEVLDPYDW